MITQGSRKAPITEICLHTSATTPAWLKRMKTVEAMRDEIRVWHVRDRGWNDIGYHFVVAPDGSRATGRPMNVIGAGVVGHNTGVIHICMVPVNEVTGITKFEDWYTVAQFKAVKALITTIREQCPITKISGHNEYAAKLCPGFRVDSKAWLRTC